MDLLVKRWFQSYVHACVLQNHEIMSLPYEWMEVEGPTGINYRRSDRTCARTVAIKIVMAKVHVLSQVDEAGEVVDFHEGMAEIMKCRACSNAALWTDAVRAPVELAKLYMPSLDVPTSLRIEDWTQFPALCQAELAKNLRFGVKFRASPSLPSAVVDLPSSEIRTPVDSENQVSISNMVGTDIRTVEGASSTKKAVTVASVNKSGSNGKSESKSESKSGSDARSAEHATVPKKLSNREEVKMILKRSRAISAAKKKLVASGAPAPATEVPIGTKEVRATPSASKKTDPAPRELPDLGPSRSLNRLTPKTHIGCLLCKSISECKKCEGDCGSCHYFSHYPPLALHESEMCKPCRRPNCQDDECHFCHFPHSRSGSGNPVDVAPMIVAVPAEVADPVEILEKAICPIDLLITCHVSKNDPKFERRIASWGKSQFRDVEGKEWKVQISFHITLTLNGLAIPTGDYMKMYVSRLDNFRLDPIYKKTSRWRKIQDTIFEKFSLLWMKNETVVLRRSLDNPEQLKKGPMRILMHELKDKETLEINGDFKGFYSNKAHVLIP